MSVFALPQEEIHLLVDEISEDLFTRFSPSEDVTRST